MQIWYFYNQNQSQYQKDKKNPQNPQISNNQLFQTTVILTEGCFCTVHIVSGTLIAAR